MSMDVQRSTPLAEQCVCKGKRWLRSVDIVAFCVLGVNLAELSQLQQLHFMQRLVNYPRASLMIHRRTLPRVIDRSDYIRSP